MAVLRNNECKQKKLIKGLEYYEDTQMKAHDIIKLTAELKSDNVQYRNRIYYCCFVFVGVDRSLPEALHIYAVKITYRTSIVGRRQVTVRFMN